MKLVKVEMLTTGPNDNYKKGAVVTVDEARAALLIKGKHAKEVEDGRVRLQKRKDI